ncbi:hypothetical protein JCM13304A_20280 [Desulfothermus okinawensis JCM 13304]
MEKKKEVEELKRAIYEKLSPRRKKFIDKIGFDNWDPFMEPKHPIDIRRDSTKKTSKELMEEFLKTKEGKKISLAYESGIYEICMGLYQSDEKYKAMFDFSIWYYNKLTQAGLDPDKAWEKK